MILRGLLGSHQHDRLSSDTRGWVLDGFAVWWPIRDLANTLGELLQLRAHQGDFSLSTIRRWDLEQWLKTKESLIDDQLPVHASPDGSFRLNRRDHRGNRLRYLIGWAAKDMRYPVFEPWAEKTIP